MDSHSIDSDSTPHPVKGLVQSVTPTSNHVGPSLSAFGGPKPSFRGPPLLVQESVLVWVATLNLLFLPWALGTMHVASQLASLGLSALALVLALLPRRGAAPSDIPAARLLRFPVFWAGILALAYVAVQGLNPSWRFVSDSNSWRLVPLKHNSFLPVRSGHAVCKIQYMASHGHFWFGVAPHLLGLVRIRQAPELPPVFWHAGDRGSASCPLGPLPTGNGNGPDLLELQGPRKGMFMASFIYRNHAGAYFDLMVAVAVGLAGWRWRRAKHMLEGPGAAIAFGFAAALIGTAVVFSASRMSIVVLVAFTLLAALRPAFRNFFGAHRHRPRRVWASVAIPLVCMLSIGLVVFEANNVWQESVRALVANPSATLRDRILTREAAKDMLLDRWILGWGAGCFRYGFPLYAQHYSENVSIGIGQPKILGARARRPARNPHRTGRRRHDSHRGGIGLRRVAAYSRQLLEEPGFTLCRGGLRANCGARLGRFRVSEPRSYDHLGDPPIRRNQMGQELEPGTVRRRNAG